MKKISTIIFLLMSLFLFACGGEKKGNSSSDSNANSSTEINTEDNDTGDNANRSYKLGKVIFTAEGGTREIEQFGIDPYTIMTWVTPKSGVEPTANVIFKSNDLQITSMVYIQDFDAMQTNYNGQKTIKSGQPIVSFTAVDITYMFSEGTITVNDFSRKTGKVKLKVEGKCNKSVLSDPSAMKTDLPASLEIDAFMPFSSVDGVRLKTEAADKFNVQ